MYPTQEQLDLIANVGGLKEFRVPSDEERARIQSALLRLWAITEDLRSSLTGPDEDPPPLLFMAHPDGSMLALDLSPIISHPDRGLVGHALRQQVAQQQPLPIFVVLATMVYMRQVDAAGGLGERVEYMDMRVETLDGFGAMLNSRVTRFKDRPPEFAEPTITLLGGESKGGGAVSDFYRLAYEAALTEGASSTKQ